MLVRPSVLIAAVGLLLSGAAIAGTTPRPRQALNVSVEISGEVTLVRATVDIEAPPQVVWAVIYDCAYAARLMEKLKSCRVLERDPAGRWDVREHIIQPVIFPAVRTVLRSEYDPPRGVVFRQVDGDVRGQAGGWRLDALENGGTRATYENRIVLGLPIAGPMFRQALRVETPKGLIKLRQASEERAKRAAG